MLIGTTKQNKCTHFRAQYQVNFGQKPDSSFNWQNSYHQLAKDLYLIV